MQKWWITKAWIARKATPASALRAPAAPSARRAAGVPTAAAPSMNEKNTAPKTGSGTPKGRAQCERRTASQPELAALQNTGVWT